MSSRTRNVLHIDLNNRTFETKSYPELYKYIGGVGIGFKLLSLHKEKEPVIFSVGPLNGYFPYASKTSVVVEDNGVVEDVYLGGSLSFRLQFAGIDSLVLSGRSDEPITLDIIDSKVLFKSFEEDVNDLGLPGKRSVLNFTRKGLFLDSHFTAYGHYLERRFVEKNVKSISITGTNTTKIKDDEEYRRLFNNLLLRMDEVKVEKNNFPSCSGCPLGCEKAVEGEIGGNVLVHSLVGCTFAESIYSDVGTVFACLSTLGYDYTHEDIENVPEFIYDVFKDLSGQELGV